MKCTAWALSRQRQTFWESSRRERRAWRERRARWVLQVVRVRRETRLEPVPHLSCFGHIRDEISPILELYAGNGVSNVLALRGDPPAGARILALGDFQHAGDLVAFFKREGERLDDQRRSGCGVEMALGKLRDEAGRIAARFGRAGLLVLGVSASVVVAARVRIRGAVSVEAGMGCGIGREPDEEAERERSAFVDVGDYTTSIDGHDGWYAQRYEGQGLLVHRGAADFERRYAWS